MNLINVGPPALHSLEDIVIAGTGLCAFGRHDGVTAAQLGVIAARKALRDAGMSWSDIEMAYGASLEGNPDTIVSDLGQTGITFINVRNGCASAGSAVLSASLAIASGHCDIAIAVGTDNHGRGAFRSRPGDWNIPQWFGESGFSVAPQFFAMKTMQYFAQYDLPLELAYQVAERAFRNGSITPHAWRQTPLSVDQIAESPVVCYPLRKYMLTNPCAGAGAAILCREEVARRFDCEPLHLAGISVKTRRPGTFDVFASSVALEPDDSPSVYASREAFEMAGIEPEDIDVIQVQDTDSGTEIIHYAECGFCEPGQQAQLIADGETELTGRFPVNTDGGLLANGEPVGASGLRQIYEISQQLRGRAGRRQVPGNPKSGFTHVYGGPGISAVTIIQR
mgnify:FL=1